MILESIPQGEKHFDVVVLHYLNEKGKILLLRKRQDNPIYPGGQWGFIAGKVKPNEDLCVAMQRELFEETGNKIEFESFKMEGISIPIVHIRPPNNKFYFISHVFSLQEGIFLQGISTSISEHSHYMFVHPERVTQKLIGTMVPDSWEVFQMFSCAKKIA